VSPGFVGEGGEPVIGGAVSADLDAAVTAMVAHLRAVHDERIVRIEVYPLDAERGDPRYWPNGRPYPEAVAVHAYNVDGLRIDARYIEAAP
jgi:hypothetical protein